MEENCERARAAKDEKGALGRTARRTRQEKRWNEEKKREEWVEEASRGRRGGDQKDIRRN